MNGLSVARLSRPGFFQRLLGRPVKANAFVEIRNLIASSAIRDVTSDAVADTLRRYRVRSRGGRKDLTAIYGEVLRHFAADEHLSDDEVNDLRHLRQVLGLTDENVRDAEKVALHPIYSATLKGVIADETVTDAEKHRLEELAKRLRLDDATVVALRREPVAEIMQRLYDRATSDRRLSAEEDGQLATLATQLGAKIDTDEASAATLERFRLLWRLDQGELPEIDAPVRLQARERCHASVAASHHEMRTVTRKVQYAGPTVSIRIMKGVHYRAGSMNLNRVTEETIKLLDTGTLYITSKRLLFDGSRKSVSIPYRKIINVKPFTDGIGVEKDAGKDQFFRFDGDLEIPLAVLDAALRAQDA